MMSHPNPFIVMWPWNKDSLALHKKMACPKTVPWDFVAPYEKQAWKNHGQTLQELHRRGGLDVTELRAVLEGKTWPEVSKDEQGAIQKVKALLHQWKETP